MVPSVAELVVVVVVVVVRSNSVEGEDGKVASVSLVKGNVFKGEDGTLVVVVAVVASVDGDDDKGIEEVKAEGGGVVGETVDVGLDKGVLLSLDIFTMDSVVAALESWPWLLLSDAVFS